MNKKYTFDDYEELASFTSTLMNYDIEDAPLEPKKITLIIESDEDE